MTGLVSALIAFGFVFGIVQNNLPLAYAKTIEIQVVSKPIAYFQVGKSDKTVFGRLRYMGGISYSSAEETLGGISGVRVVQNGARFLAISDKGSWFSGDFVRDENGTLNAIANASVAPMRDGNGKIFSSKKNGDAEGLEVIGNFALVSFERNSRILRYRIDLQELNAKGKSFRKKIRKVKLPNNNGLEAITILQPVSSGDPDDARIAVLSEHSLNKQGNIRGFVSTKKKWKEFSVKKIGKYKITDATLLEDESILVLERRFSITSGASIRIRKIPVALIKPGALVDGEIIFEADNRYQIDNLEGISDWKNDKGQTIITLVSDDNFSYLQRNIILEFELLPAGD